MIFLTVGTQLAFDRLVRTVDDWARDTGRCDVFAQIGPNAYKPSQIEWVENIPPAEFNARFESAEVVIAHAGMGSILTALSLAKPIVIMPRQARLREQRNDHQLATAARFSAVSGVTVAHDEAELGEKLRDLSTLQGGDRIGPFASAELLGTLRDFIISLPNGKLPRRPAR